MRPTHHPSHRLVNLCQGTLFVLVVVWTTACSAPLSPPVARVSPTQLEAHGQTRVDNYYWLKERGSREVIEYLEAENDYAAAVMAHTVDLEKKLFTEITARISPTDLSVPYRLDDYFYYTRFAAGKDYAVYCRKKGSLKAPEEIMLDANLMAESDGFLSVRNVVVSSQQDILAYAVDRVGRRFYTVHFKDLKTGEVLDETIPQVTGNMAWANDNRTLFYTKQEPTTLRWHRVYRHQLGTDAADDVLVYEETDTTFGTQVYKTKSKKFLMIASDQTLSTEYRFLDADNPEEPFTLLLPRQRGHEYQADHYADHFYLRSNDDANNFRLVKAPISNPARENWQEVVPHRDDVYLSSFEIFKDHLVVVERQAGLVQIRVLPWSGEPEHYLEFDEPAYQAYIGTNPDFDTQTLRFGYSSLTTPTSIYDYDMVKRKRHLLKREEVLGGFDADAYQSERIYAAAEDGTQIPISLVYSKEQRRRHKAQPDGTSPLLLYGYGSYGSSSNPNFRSPRLSLLDRGFIYAIAHIRGGQELGREWYEQGKLLNKKNTFTDFIDCAEHLVEAGYTRPDQLFAMGRSAGGLLMGAVVNMRPDLFQGVVAGVPFVDVITTMLDESIPLTMSEYDEWGDPNQEPYYKYMLSYSPYDNVEAKDYPHLLVTTALHDSQVQYWEPAKWVAKLRATKTDQRQLLFRTHMTAGHGGASGRFRQHQEAAFTYAFLLDLAGITE